MARNASPKPYVFANATCAVTTEHGSPVILNRGDVWDGLDPLVAYHQWAFDAEPPFDAMKRTYMPDGFDIYGDPIPAVVG